MKKLLLLTLTLVGLPVLAQAEPTPELSAIKETVKLCWGVCIEGIIMH